MDRMSFSIKTRNFQTRLWISKLKKKSVEEKWKKLEWWTKLKQTCLKENRLYYRRSPERAAVLEKDSFRK